MFLEIGGFWTPEYIQAKVHTLQTFRDQSILLAVSGPAQQPIGELAADVIPFKSVLLIKDVLERLNSFAG